MIKITHVEHDDDYKAIISLQRENLKANTTEEIRKTDGYVTVEHTPELLRRMNDQIPTIIAKDDKKRLIGYALAMSPEFVMELPKLQYLLDAINIIYYDEKILSSYPYYMMGQSCVAFGYRGRGILRQMLEKHREMNSNRYRLLITSVCASNLRSLRAHTSTGFRSVYVVNNSVVNEDWHILVWDWQKIV